MRIERGIRIERNKDPAIYRNNPNLPPNSMTASLIATGTFSPSLSTSDLTIEGFSLKDWFSLAFPLLAVVFVSLRRRVSSPIDVALLLEDLALDATGFES